MTTRNLIAKLAMQEDLNFLLTNRIPRKALTHFMGWFSRIENPLVCRLSIAAWRLFTDLDLSDARKSDFRSLHDCFTRELRPGSRAVDASPEALTSPSDGIVGACGSLTGTSLLQAKGFPYSLKDLLVDDEFDWAEAPAHLAASRVRWVARLGCAVNADPMAELAELAGKHASEAGWALFLARVDSGEVTTLDGAPPLVRDCARRLAAAGRGASAADVAEAFPY